jgi:hypothetical protein
MDTNRERETALAEPESPPTTPKSQGTKRGWWQRRDDA